ncbi:MAG TPA: UDP-N-acetylmuramoyl-tripeptide--D-alanyl-D-alanine ligase [Acidimicrobiia bacterium]|nr:UDP-N-acetylmuramoyl-tripeptide--D-alanyl-D-alanine ligase [Acidimicrobiia bacterium]
MRSVVLIGLGVAAGIAGLRWLRVAQREHYLGGTVARFAWRWWTLGPVSIGLGLVALAGLGACLVREPFALLTALAVALGPPGLGLRGRTSPLAWTGRLRRLALVVGVVVALALLAGWFLHVWVTAVVVTALPVVFDLALVLLAPVERRMGDPWVDKAARALSGSGAKVVAITGSYGKTSTKGYVAQLLAGDRRVLASPASFNNRMGLARAINEHLAGGLDVFIAEMGTYGKGEIADLCAWIPPDIAVITAIGPVHLERFGSEENIVEAKAEILERASVAILNVDDPRLAAVAERERGRRRVITASTGATADVRVVDGEVSIDGALIARAPETAHHGNVACAVAVAVALGVSTEEIRERLGGLTEPEHRRTVITGAGGAMIIDDTFNSNPAGARAALEMLQTLDVSGRRVVVTPGMVELGRRQEDENRAFAAQAARVADFVAVVGRTNRRALVAGARQGEAEVLVFPDREAAVAWVRSHLGPGDAVLYENDLPDHFP